MEAADSPETGSLAVGAGLAALLGERLLGVARLAVGGARGIEVAAERLHRGVAGVVGGEGAELVGGLREADLRALVLTVVHPLAADGDVLAHGGEQVGGGAGGPR